LYDDGLDDGKENKIKRWTKMREILEPFKEREEKSERIV